MLPSSKCALIDRRRTATIVQGLTGNFPFAFTTGDAAGYKGITQIMSSNAPVVAIQNGVTVVSLGPEYENLDDAILEELQKSILAAVDGAEPPKVVLDLSHTQFFGSAFLEVLLQARNRLTAREGGRFAISGLTTYCAEVISITHLDRVWKIFESVDEAVSQLAAD